MIEQIRSQEQAKVELLAPLYATQIMEALESRALEKRSFLLDVVVGRILMASDVATGKKLFDGVAVEGLDGTILVDHAPKGAFNGFVAESMIVSDSTSMLLGVIKLYYNGQFFQHLQQDAQIKLFQWLGGLALLLFLVWLLLLNLLRPLKRLTTTLRQPDISGLEWSMVKEWISDEIWYVYEAIRDLLAALKQERELLEERVQERTRELHGAMEATAMASQAKSDFLATMSHEIRTPLNGLLGLAQLLERTELSLQQKRYVHAMTTSGEHLFTMLNDILDISKIESGKLILEPVDFLLRPFFHDILESFLPLAANKGLIISCTLDPEMPAALWGDPFKLRQILFNLIGNAIKFTEQGEVSVQVTLEHRSDAGDCVFCVTVQDTGVGIDADKQAQLFTPFVQEDSTTTRRYGGSGLGLALSRQLAEHMGGSLTFFSIKNQGSQFTLQLCLPVGNITESQMSALLLPAWSILIVDDEPINRDVLQALLEGDGHEVMIADNGFVALEVLQNKHFHVVVMDLRMPQMDGIETTRCIRSSGRPYASVPIIILTADVTADAYTRCIEAGVSQVLSKPVRLPKLYQIMATLIAHGQLDHHQPVSSDQIQEPDNQARLIDQEAVTILLQAMDFNRLLEMVETLSNQGGHTVREMQTAQQDNQGARIGDLAHGVQGVAAFLGMVQLKSVAAQIEWLVTTEHHVVGHGGLTSMIMHYADVLTQSCEQVRRLIAVHAVSVSGRIGTVVSHTPEGSQVKSSCETA